MSGVNGPDIAAAYQLLTEVARQLGEVAQQVREIAQRASAHDRRFEQIDARLISMSPASTNWPPISPGCEDR
jgi:DNA repair ATPase RecN